MPGREFDPLRARDAGLARVRRLSRRIATLGLVASAGLAVMFAHVLPGHTTTNATTPATTPSTEVAPGDEVTPSAPTDSVPSDSPELQPPEQAPDASQGPGVVSSGGS